jgi:hypothetical protein
MILKEALHRNNIKTIGAIFFMLLLFNCSSGGGDDSTSNPPPSDTIAQTIPADLAAINITETATDLSWTASTDNVGVSSYSIYKDNVVTTTTQNISFSVTGLTANTTYAFKVSAKDNAGNTSGFSNTVSVTTLSSNPELQFASGDIETYVGNIIDNVPGDSGDDYTVPTTAQLDIWNLTIDALLADNIPEAVLKSSEVNYQITEFTDTSLTPNQVFYILEEKSSQSNYWGTYVFSKTPTRDNLILMATHIKNDTNTGKEAVYCFKNNVAKAVFISGTHRCNSNDSSSCSGTTSTCGSSESYRLSDMAHNTNSVFQKTTENVFTNISSSVFIQLHGFAKQASDPYVILSNGTRETSTTDYATLIKDALLIEDGSLTFELAHINTNWTRLIGFTNTQGRLINNSTDHCNTSATSTTGRFVHIEQEKSKLRDDATGWAKMSNALESVFN